MTTVKDPVCGMNIEPATAAASEEYGGKTYYFCSENCYQQFVVTPDASPPEPQGSATGAQGARLPDEYELAERFAVFLRRRRLALRHLRVAHVRVPFVTFPVRSRDKCGTRSGC